MEAGNQDLLEQIIAKSETLVRPCLALHEYPSRTEAGEHPWIGIWGAAGVVQDSVITDQAGEWKHWLSIDCTWLVANGFGLTGCLSLYQNSDEYAEEDNQWYVAYDANGSLPSYEQAANDVAVALADAIAEAAQYNDLPRAAPALLFGEESTSFPSWEALILTGNLARNAETRSVEDAYYTHYFKRDKLSEADAFLGGWPAVWGYDDYEEVQHLGRLVLTTIRGAEPWVEIWLLDSGEFQVRARNT